MKRTSVFASATVGLLFFLGHGNASAGPARILEADTPTTTVEGNTFIAPAGWTITTRGPATILEAPEGGSFIAIVDVKASDADRASARAGVLATGQPLRRLESRDDAVH